MWFAVTRSAMRRGSGADESASASVATADTVAASLSSDEAGMIDSSIEGQCYSQQRAGATDFVLVARSDNLHLSRRERSTASEARRRVRGSRTQAEDKNPSPGFLAALGIRPLPVGER